MLTLAAPGVDVVVAPDRGGRIERIWFAGHDLLLVEADSPGTAHSGAFVMAPWAGRVRNGRFSFEGVEHQLPINAPPHAIHGTVRDHPWTVEEADASHARLTCDLGPDWPWPGWCEQELTVTTAGLQVGLSVHARDGAFPASVGLHPWFRRRLTPDGADVELQLPAAAMYRRDGDGIPTGELVPPPPGPWDDCFTELSGPPVLRWTESAVELAVETGGPCVVVYDEMAPAVCVEPQSGPPDALNLAPRIATPGRPVRLSIDLLWSAPQPDSA